MGKRHVLERVQRVAAPLSTVSAFFETPDNLERITPPFLNFRILTSGVKMEKGAIIEYRLKMRGIPMGWRTRIDEYVPGERFVDFQEKGPYRYWHHLHTFRAIDGGTELVDRVTYELPFGPLGAVAHAVFVRAELARIFDHRFEVAKELFGDLDGNSRARGVDATPSFLRTSSVVE